jgi:tetratricopeptide (TPR) repeat protein
MIAVATVMPRSRTQRLLSWLGSDSVLPRLIRLSTVAGFLRILVEVSDQFKVHVLPDNWRGLIVYCLVCIAVFEAVELIVLNAKRPRPLVDPTRESPERVFAAGLITYARSLSSEGQEKDQAVLELRSWSSRLLHLMGAFRERIELGQIALEAAAALQDQRTQASILIDDLGWSLYKASEKETAIANIEEALRIVNESLKNAPADESLISLKTKALRHIANIRAETQNITEARHSLDAARQAAEELIGPEYELNCAQIDHSEAEIILRHIDRNIGPTGQADPSGELGKLLGDALVLAEHAESIFSNLGDGEREAKALKVKVLLLAHDTRKQKYREALTRLSRLERQVARDLR